MWKNVFGELRRRKIWKKRSWEAEKEDQEEIKKREMKERIVEPGEKAGQNTMKRGKDPQSVMFVPYTPNSELAKELRKVKDMMERS